MAKMRDRLQKPVACSNLDSGLALANNNENRHGHFDLIYCILRNGLIGHLDGYRDLFCISSRLKNNF